MSDAGTALRQDVHALYSDHHGWLRAWLRRRLGCGERAADLAQDTFVRVLSARQAADTSAWREPRAYLTTIARNLMADHWRRAELERAYLDALAAQPEALAPSPEAQLLIMETLLRIDACLAALPALTRRIFLNSQLDGMVYADIAAQQGISLPTVKRHMGQAFLACLSAA
ncbi:sigma-70 family RNA polymerase sigma factor [Comamonas antarctica]|uniref:Sigma-70 family RNA polymerase sigma factor n=1 Tax=Comamonas antarctica TaxID=2743470 RepID=A0A6N1X2G1_9BURK|nr:sigma-70 family RNA polymerase sigma factor [Comamonas antarctica]QKV53531.1 sigma-70 family RNA polymerase sigma factor [Comamonas antarctica]